jgi:predicted RNA binding protein YcfA (HicA-like mRNA interferase family)
MTWSELIRRLRSAGFVELRHGKGSHLRMANTETGRVVIVSVHGKKEVGTGLARRILKEAGL